MGKKKKTAKKVVGHCSMHGCNGDAVYVHSGLCAACYQFMYYWKNRSVTDKMKHVQKIERWNERIHTSLVPTKVTSIKRNRRRA